MWKTAAETKAVRDYFQIEDEAGERFWLVRAGDGEDPARDRRIGFCMASSHDALCRTAMRLAFLVPARGLLGRGIVRRCRRTRDRGAGDHGLEQLGRYRARHEAAKATGVRLIVGARLQLTDGSEILVYPTDRPAYSRLCRLLSLGKSRAGKARCDLTWDDVAAWAKG